MFVKLAVISCVVAMSSAVWNGPLAGGVPAHQYPAGVSPQACPNFPNCANPAVAAQPNAPAPAWNGAPAQQWNQGGYNPAPVPQYNNANAGLSPLDRGEYTGDGDWHGEGLSESGAYGNQGGQWNGNNGGQWNNGGSWNQGGWNGGQNNPGAYNPQAPPAGLGQIPAGVNPQSCPNYPFCH
ncbi:unnamed protein product [Brassicogethes aeneus]|uniref:Cuticle protein CPCFC domain-containing protein n=1 Tax=Brassicogethes aeneus TaxID=1431903 RepID=A0A9P0B187_BRAAE|nr:unnamed protein product [Brassicogethes aeneus]